MSTDEMLKKQKCPICEIGHLLVKKDIISEFDGFVFVENGKVCSHCGEEYISENEAQKTIEIAKTKDIWPEPLKLYRKLSRSGKSLTLRIPSDIERQLNLKENMEVSISKIGNKLVLEPIHNFDSGENHQSQNQETREVDIDNLNSKIQKKRNIKSAN